MGAFQDVNGHFDFDGIKGAHGGMCYEWHELKYNASWDWLMPVVQKIDQGDVVFSFHRGISGKGHTAKVFGLNEPYPRYAFVDVSDPDMLKTIYQAVVEYIIWHNENH